MITVKGIDQPRPRQELKASKRGDPDPSWLWFARNSAKSSPRKGLCMRLAGEIRIAVPEGLGTSWLAPRLVEFQQAFPNILVDMNCITRPADLSRHEADIAIHLAQPAAPGIERIRLGRMHLMLFASQQYFDTYGVPKTTDELVEHRLVMPAADQSAAREAFESLFRGRPSSSCR
jgi:DNA-binding transcriptional LysR family regulator